MACVCYNNTVMSSKTIHIPCMIDLPATLLCGQSFAWADAGGEYIGCIENRPALVRRAACGTEIITAGDGDEGYWARYFDAGRQYHEIAARYAHDPHVQAAFNAYGGLRLLRQPHWETLCAFIISANNNVKRITGIISRLSEALGEGHTLHGHRVYAFPTPEKIVAAGEPLLTHTGLGYRAPYIYDAARRAAEGFDFGAIAALPYGEARQALLSFKGVGPKVADCILLFAFGHTDAFPVDVWVRRVMQRLYHVSGGDDQIRLAGKALFGEDAGIVQQALFHGARMGLYDALLAI